MNGIEKITARIEKDCQLEIDQLLQAANDRAEQVKQTYEAQAAAEKEKAEEAARQAGRRRLGQLESAARMEAKSRLLAAKQACLDEAFAKALETLQALPEGEYIDLLAEMARTAAGSGGGEIILSAADRARVGQQVAEKAGLRLADETREMDGGLILRCGNVEYNCAFETKLRVLRESMAAEVAQILFP